jgi:serine protease AprX
MPDRVKCVLQATATPMPAYERHEVGPGYLNAYDAVRAAQGR